MQKYYNRNKSFKGIDHQLPKYYKNNYEREYYNTFKDHGNRRKHKDHYKDKYRDKNSMIMIDPMIQIILIVEIGHMTETGHIVETGTTPKNTKETGHMLETDLMTEMSHIVEVDHDTTVEMSIRKKIINIRKGLEIIMRMSMRTGMVGIDMNTNSEMTDMT